MREATSLGRRLAEWGRLGRDRVRDLVPRRPVVRPWMGNGEVVLRGRPCAGPNRWRRPRKRASASADACLFTCITSHPHPGKPSVFVLQRAEDGAHGAPEHRISAAPAFGTAGTQCGADSVKDERTNALPPENRSGLEVIAGLGQVSWTLGDRTTCQACATPRNRSLANPERLKWSLARGRR